MATPAAPAPAPAQVIANDNSNAGGDWIYVEPDNVPDQPASAGPVRVPYPVKLNDPIVILKLPTFSVPVLVMRVPDFSELKPSQAVFARLRRKDIQTPTRKGAQGRSVWPIR